MPEEKHSNEAPRVYFYSRVDANSLFGYTDDYMESAIAHQANCLHFELMDQRHSVVADMREVRNVEISDRVLQQMMEMAAAGHFDTLYVMSTDRLSRDQDRCLSIVETLDRQGIEVISLKEGCINIADEPGKPSKLQIAQLMRQAYATAGGKMPLQ